MWIVLHSTMYLDITMQNLVMKSPPLRPQWRLLFNLNNHVGLLRHNLDSDRCIINATQWLKKQAEAKRIMEVENEDLTEEEKNPVWLKDKAKYVYSLIEEAVVSGEWKWCVAHEYTNTNRLLNKKAFHSNANHPLSESSWLIMNKFDNCHGWGPVQCGAAIWPCTESSTHPMWTK